VTGAHAVGHVVAHGHADARAARRHLVEDDAQQARQLVHLVHMDTAGLGDLL